MYNALIDVRVSTLGLEIVPNLLNSGIVPVFIDSTETLERTLACLPANLPVLWLDNPSVRIDRPLVLINWFHREQSVFRTVATKTRLLGFYPDAVFIHDGKVVNGSETYFCVPDSWCQESLLFTGERVVPELGQKTGPLDVHLKMYQFMSPLAKGRVLDLACGCGYGSFELAKTADLVVGVDISRASVEYASSNYQKENLVFCLADATSLLFPDGAFDNVVSVETFEHVEDVRLYLSEVSRVLKPGGRLGFTTPNGSVHPFKPERPAFRAGHHVRHYTEVEIQDLLGGLFESVTVAGLDPTPDSSGHNNLGVLCRKKTGGYNLRGFLGAS